MATSLYMLRQKHMITLKYYNARKINPPRESEYKQNADNCWIFNMANDLYFNTGIKFDIDKFLEFAKGFRVNVLEGGYARDSGPLIAEFLKDKNIAFYKIPDVLKNIPLFTKLLSQGYSLIYSRAVDKNFWKDVRDNDVLDTPIKFDRKNKDWHLTTLRLEDKYFTEYGSYGNDSIYNKFRIKDANVLFAMIKSGAIKKDMYFLDFKQ